MKIKVEKSRSYGSTVLQFFSGDSVCQIETFCVQIPGKILFMKTGYFEIPDEFMQKELDIKENPIIWWNRKKEELGLAASECGNPNNIFIPFFDAIGKFCDYDREKEMKNWGKSSEKSWASLAWDPD